MPGDMALPVGPSRTIVDAVGMVRVPAEPRRVVVLDTAPLDAALALGVKPVGSMTVFGDFPAYLGDRTAGIEVIGQGNEPNLETILRLKPDLILGSTIGIKPIYRSLARIAPVVLTKGSGRSGEWADNLRLYGEALGRADAAEQLLQDYQREISSVKERLSAPQETVVSVLGVVRSEVYFYTVESFAGSVLEDFGFARPPKQARPRRWVSWAGSTSREDFDNIDGDVIFLIYSSSFEDGRDRQAFVSDPLWSKLNAVRSGRVHEVRGDVWVAGRSILAAYEIINDVARSLLDSHDDSG